ncbi:MAG: RluA family pseudouridine synthase [Acidimicrobiales bacterium]
MPELRDSADKGSGKASRSSVLSAEPLGAPRSFRVPASLAGERVDRAVSLVMDMPRARVALLIVDGHVTVDGVPPKQRSRTLNEGQVVEVIAGEYVPDVAVADSTVHFDIIYSDEWMAVIDKPAGLVVHHGAGHTSGTLADGLLARFPALGQFTVSGAINVARPGIVHRLDRETSGLMVVGLTPEVIEELGRRMSARQIERHYTALVSGNVHVGRGIVEAPVGRIPWNPMNMGVTATGRHAVTHFTVMDRYAKPVEASLLYVRLETGRTHQIRVHMSSIGHPVVGDTRYKGPSWKSLGLGSDILAGAGAGARDVPAPGEECIFLHAGKLSLEHPVTGRHMEWRSALPSPLAMALQQFTVV